ncbi:DUF7344 domain-containing protein [Salinarchaeum laminariae]|uniref:DUF7344 domain-containing protein n=1 Tax=Salinarchaeum laminariae TaxID=869888 RepID=UPI0020BE6A54|nr:hypothetical protein [Salinarchaeum laminariae]
MSDVDCCPAIPLDPVDVFEAISNSRRRRVILSLSRSNDPVSASDLAVEIAARENAVDPSQVTGEQRTRVYIGLTQGHLEKLDDLGVAQYDDRSKQVKPTDATNPLARQIRRITTECYTPAEDSAESVGGTER